MECKANAQFKHIAILVPAVAKSFHANAERQPKKKHDAPTKAIRNAGKSTSRKVSASIPPKLRFDVLEKNKLKTQSVALANVSAKPKDKCFKILHYA